MDPAQRAAEQAVVRAALKSGWLTQAAVGEARAAAQAGGPPLLVGLRGRLDAAQQEALGRVYREALAAAGPGQTRGDRGPAGSSRGDGDTLAGVATKGMGPAASTPKTSWGNDPVDAPPPSPGPSAQDTALSGVAPTAAAPATAVGEAPAAALAAAWTGGDLDRHAPKRLGSYVVERELARGGMGAVYVGRHEELGRRVALKVMLPEASGPDEAARFDREARALAALRHPHVVTLHEAGEEDGRRWMALELVPGGSLQDRLTKEGPLDPRAAVTWVEQAARALSAAHERGLLHRDLKPANLLLDEAGRVKVTDFGIAKPLDAHTRQLTRTGASIGTPAYAPPEQCGGGRAVDVRADVYGLGATLYALLAGQPPFDGPFLQVMAAVIREDPPPPSVHRAGLPPDLERVVLRCLEKEAADRYPTAAALADELGRWLRGEPLEVQPPTARQRLRRWRRRHPVLSLVLAGAVPLLAVAAVVIATQRPPPAPPAVVPTTVEWRAPHDGLTTPARSIQLTGTIGGPATWVELGVEGGAAPRRVRGGDFTLVVPLKQGENRLALRWRASTGEEGALPARAVTSTQMVAWFEELPAERKPPLPLPDGLSPSDEPEVYVWARDGSELVWVPPGPFTMFSDKRAFVDPSRNPDAEKQRPPPPPRLVTLERGAFIGRYEVTWAQWEAFCTATRRPPEPRKRLFDFYMGHGASTEDFQNKEFPLDPPVVPPADHPAMNITYDQALEYCAWAGLRLPSEAEWERAARGLDGRVYAWGDEPTPAAGDVSSLFEGDAYLHTAPVGAHPKDRTPIGCYDMGGNVSEWVSDPVELPPGATRLSRGPPWHIMALGLQLSQRYASEHGGGAYNSGFRVALSPR